MIAFSCEQCGRQMEAEDAAPAVSVKCPGCGQLAAVPEGATIASPAPPTPLSSSGDVFGSNPSGDAPPGVTLVTADDYDFLAPPQDPGEIGRLGPYRVLKVLGRRHRRGLPGQGPARTPVAPRP